MPIPNQPYIFIFNREHICLGKNQRKGHFREVEEHEQRHEAQNTTLCVENYNLCWKKKYKFRFGGRGIFIAFSYVPLTQKYRLHKYFKATET